MKRTIVICVSLFCLVFSGCGFESNTEAHQTSGNVSVPDFLLENLNNEPVRLSSFKGRKPVLMMFWATWCPHCVREIRSLVDLRNQIPGSKLEIIAINIEESERKVKSYAERYRLNYTVVLDRDGDTARNFGVQGVPTIIFVDKDGKGVFAEHRLDDYVKQAVRDHID